MIRDLETLLAETKFVVEATQFEKQMLWEKFSKDSIFKIIHKHNNKVATEYNKYNWTQFNGFMVTVGHIKKKPVNISCMFDQIDGVTIMFWEPISQVIDHDMIEKWLKENCSPLWDYGTRLAHTNASNFHNVIHYIQDANKVSA